MLPIGTPSARRDRRRAPRSTGRCSMDGAGRVMRPAGGRRRLDLVTVTRRRRPFAGTGSGRPRAGRARGRGIDRSGHERGAKRTAGQSRWSWKQSHRALRVWSRPLSLPRRGDGSRWTATCRERSGGLCHASRRAESSERRDPALRGPRSPSPTCPICGSGLGRPPSRFKQARMVQAALTERGIASELVTFTTMGDKRLDEPLSAIGGKGLFTTEIETLLRAREDCGGSFAEGSLHRSGGRTGSRRGYYRARTRGTSWS